MRKRVDKERQLTEANLALEGRIARHALEVERPAKYQLEGLEASDYNQMLAYLEEN